MRQTRERGPMDAMVIGAGLVGQAVLQVLQREGWIVRGTAPGSSDLELLALDPQDRAAVQELIAQLKPRIVFLGAGLVDGHRVGSSIDVSESVIVPVVEACGRCDTRLVFFSSDEVFDGTAGPYGEDELPNPTTPAGRTLWDAECRIRELLPSRALILRTSLPFGWHPGVDHFAMEVWHRLQAGEPLRAANDQWSNPTYAEYLAEVAVRLLQMDVVGTVNVAGRDRMASSNFARALARSMGLDPSLIVPIAAKEIAEPEARPRQGGLKTARLTELLGTEPLTLPESLSRFRRQWRADTHVTYSTRTLCDEASKLKDEIFDRVHRYYQLMHGPQPFVPYKSRVQYAGRVYGPEELINLVDSALEFWLTLGPYGERFEQQMKRFFGARDFLAVNSGSTANLLTVMTLMSPQLRRPLRPGDEVITTAVGFPTTLTPIVHGGLIPVFVDVELGTYNIDPGLIESAISDKTRAIMVAHTLGNPCDLEVLVELARRYDLYLVEDCCDALGGTFAGRLVGTFGDLATLSFYPAHQITMGEGGGVVVNRPWLSRTARSVRDWGRDCWCAPGESNTCGKRFGWQLGELPQGYDHKYTYSNLGYNFKPTDMQAAVGVAQFERITDFVAKRRRNFQWLYEGLAPYQDEVILPRWDSRANPSWFGFPITVKREGTRHRLVHWLENAKIETREIFGGNLLRQPAFQHIQARVHGELSVSDRVMRDTFFIGVYPGLTEEMLAFVVDVFRKFFERHGGVRP